MAKYDVDRFETPPDEDLICCICQCVLDNPLESPCRHVFCKVCIETWLTNRNNCPNCRKRLRVSRLKPVLPIVRNMINRLLIICENREHGCTTGIKLEMYDKHVQNCDFAPIKCLNTGCGQTVLRENMLGHELTCKYRLIMCKKGCGLPISMEKLKKHNCLDELKKSMTAMEEQYKQRLLDLETKLNTKIQVLEDRIKAMEENCQQDYGSGWGSARDSYSSMAGFDESDSPPSRDLEYTDIQDYEENNDDDSNSFYFSGNEDNDFESTPEYQEAQTDDLTYEVYSPDVGHPEEEQQEQQEQQEHENAEGGEEMRQGTWETAFFLNSDAESSNGSEGDLNDSLLDSSDSDQEPVPLQVYEVSPTSPHSEQHPVESSATERGSFDEGNDVASGDAPHSSTHRERSRRDRHRQDGQSGQSSDRERRSAIDTPSSEGFHPRDNPYDNEHSSLCSLRVEYGSTGRSSPREPGQDYATEPEEVSEANRSTNNVDSSLIQESDSHSGDGRRHSRESSGRSRGNRRSSQSRRSHSSRRSRTETNPETQSAQSIQESATNEQSGALEQSSREYFYGVPIDESDSSTDPPWEKNSEDPSSDVSISDDSLLMYDSFEEDDDNSDGSSSPEVYEQFLSSLHNVDSSESDRTWVPGDQHSSNDDDDDDDVTPLDHPVDDPTDHRESSSQQDSSQAVSEQPSRSSSRTSRTRSSRRSAKDRQGDRPASDRDPPSQSTDSEMVTLSRKRPAEEEESSSESENTEDSRLHPAWKRRR